MRRRWHQLRGMASWLRQVALVVALISIGGECPSAEATRGDAKGSEWRCMVERITPRVESDVNVFGPEVEPGTCLFARLEIGQVSPRADQLMKIYPSIESDALFPSELADQVALSDGTELVVGLGCEASAGTDHAVEIFSFAPGTPTVLERQLESMATHKGRQEDCRVRARVRLIKQIFASRGADVLLRICLKANKCNDSVVDNAAVGESGSRLKARTSSLVLSGKEALPLVADGLEETARAYGKDLKDDGARTRFRQAFEIAAQRCQLESFLKTGGCPDDEVTLESGNGNAVVMCAEAKLLEELRGLYFIAGAMANHGALLEQRLREGQELYCGLRLLEAAGSGWLKSIADNVWRVWSCRPLEVPGEVTAIDPKSGAIWTVSRVDLEKIRDGRRDQIVTLLQEKDGRTIGIAEISAALGGASDFVSRPADLAMTLLETLGSILFRRDLLDVVRGRLVPHFGATQRSGLIKAGSLVSVRIGPADDWVATGWRKAGVGSAIGAIAVTTFPRSEASPEACTTCPAMLFDALDEMPELTDFDVSSGNARPALLAVLRGGCQIGVYSQEQYGGRPIHQLNLGRGPFQSIRFDQSGSYLWVAGPWGAERVDLSEPEKNGKASDSSQPQPGRGLPEIVRIIEAERDRIRIVGLGEQGQVDGIGRVRLAEVMRPLKRGKHSKEIDWAERPRVPEFWSKLALLGGDRRKFHQRVVLGKDGERGSLVVGLALPAAEFGVKGWKVFWPSEAVGERDLKFVYLDGSKPRTELPCLQLAESVEQGNIERGRSGEGCVVLPFSSEGVGEGRIASLIISDVSARSSTMALRGESAPNSKGETLEFRSFGGSLDSSEATWARCPEVELDQAARSVGVYRAGSPPSGEGDNGWMPFLFGDASPGTVEGIVGGPSGAYVLLRAGGKPHIGVVGVDSLLSVDAEFGFGPMCSGAKK